MVPRVRVRSQTSAWMQVYETPRLDPAGGTYPGRERGSSCWEPSRVNAARLILFTSSQVCTCDSAGGLLVAYHHHLPLSEYLRQHCFYTRY